MREPDYIVEWEYGTSAERFGRLGHADPTLSTVSRLARARFPVQPQAHDRTSIAQIIGATTATLSSETGSVTREKRLGIDIGRVIIAGDAHPDGGDTAFFQGDEATMLATPEMPGAVEHIAILVRLFEGRVWLVSKCGERTQARTLRWLAGHDFWRRTGIDPTHVRFCRQRADKRGHCEELGITHFVDDRIEVHHAIHGVVEHQYLFGPQKGEAPDYTVPVLSWPEARRQIEATMRRRDRSNTASVTP